MKNKKDIKTHWLQSPNKNYLGHWDLPNGQDLILTIKSAQWEEVKNPITNSSEAKRVIRFVEDVKPMICNQTNAQSILDCTGEKFMEDSIGKKIKLCVSTVRVKKCETDCIRVVKCQQSDLQDLINVAQLKELQELIDNSTKTTEEICKALKIQSLNKLPLSKFESMKTRLKEIQK